MEQTTCVQTSQTKSDMDYLDCERKTNGWLAKKLIIYNGLLILFCTVTFVTGLVQIRVILRHTQCTMFLISDLLTICLVTGITVILALIGVSALCSAKRNSLKMIMIGLIVTVVLLSRSFLITVSRTFEISDILTKNDCKLDRKIQSTEWIEPSMGYFLVNRVIKCVAKFILVSVQVFAVSRAMENTQVHELSPKNEHVWIPQLASSNRSIVKHGQKIDNKKGVGGGDAKFRTCPAKYLINEIAMKDSRNFEYRDSTKVDFWFSIP
ncbi:hypothetical protein FBUS_01622 [Fasciolopsis buskii]|uniref:Uncharacterized protein n=1 Tax=Fasciolopsis buskii TaxID=27845 RepID=A0A8E0S2F2_9TREM|nr:hypothetical protein FBUS_01622 [Fasciolopsis buski]